jgi:hypothetical protein
VWACRQRKTAAAEDRLIADPVGGAGLPGGRDGWLAAVADEVGQARALGQHLEAAGGPGDGGVDFPPTPRVDASTLSVKRADDHDAH